MAPCSLLPNDKWLGEKQLMNRHIKRQKRQKAGLKHTKSDAEILRLTVLESPEGLRSLLLINLFLISAVPR